MNDRRFDTMTRALAQAASRRKALLAALAIGATALASSRRSEAQDSTSDGSTDGSAPPAGAVSGTTLCAGEGQPCVMLTGCCSGFTCVTSAINPNQGFCQSGGTGGVQIAPPLMAGNGDGSAAQPAPTRTPRPRKTHTPGSNHTNNNTSNRSAIDLKVADIDCYPHPNDPVGPRLTLRNLGTDRVNLRTLTTLRNPTYNGANATDAVPITQQFRLKPRKSITFVREGATASGHLSPVWLPNDFFSTAQADIGKEGVKVTYESASGTTYTLTGNCPDKPEASDATTDAAGEKQRTAGAKKKRNRKHKQK